MNNNEINHIAHITHLLRKQVQQQPLTAAEQQELESWLSESAGNRAIFERLMDEQQLAADLVQLRRTDTAAQLKIVNRRLAKKRRIKSFRRWAPIAASLIILASLSLWLYQRQIRQTAHAPAKLASEYGGDVLPGSNRATLTLSGGGKAIQLDESNTGITSAGDSVVYENGKGIAAAAAAQSATLTTPRGGQYKVTLPDGSVVQLNAGSSLQYPLHFTGSQRNVALTGEAYFEVSRNEKQPFIVHTAQQQVRVLGTVFNINAYNSREATTLVSGKVAVKQVATQTEKQLLPGQQAVTEKGSVTVRQIDPADFIGWKNGLISGSPVSLTDIIPEIERWYDVNFVYPPHFSNSERAYISISRKEKLSAVLKALQLTYNVSFQIKEKEVIIR
ncbi:MAG: FecR domain-containing protein [Niabella sp.]